VVGVAEHELGARLRQAEVRAVGGVGGEPSPVEPGTRHDLGIEAGGAEREAGAHAVADHPDPPAFGSLAHGREVDRRVGGDALGGEHREPRPGQREERLPSTRSPQVAVRRRLRGRARPVQHVRGQHGVAPRGHPVRHLLDLRSQPEGIDVEEHTRTRAGEIGLGGAVRCLELDVRHDLQSSGALVADDNGSCLEPS
jgi:hypothetical protein